MSKPQFRRKTPYSGTGVVLGPQANDRECVMNQEELDEVVALVSARTIRNVSLDDVTGRVLAYSTITPTADRVRIDAVLSKEVPSGTRSWEAQHRVNSRTRVFAVPGDPDSGLLPRICIPLLVRGVRVGYLWVQANSAEDDLRSTLEDLRQWQQGIEYLAGRVFRALGVSLGNATVEDDSLQDLVSGQSEDPAEELASRIEAAEDARLIVFTGDTSSPSSEILPSLAYRHALHDASRASLLAGLLGPSKRDVVGFTDDQHGIFMLPSRAHVSDFIAKISHALRLRTAEMRASTVPHGISAVVRDPRECRTAYRQAVTALQAQTVDPAVTSSAYEDVGIYQLYAHTTATQPSQRLLALRAGSGGAERLRILERVYDSPGPVQRVADALHMHRSSVYNHLQRVEKLIDADPLDPLVRLELHTGLKLLRWLERPRFEAPVGTNRPPQVF